MFRDRFLTRSEFKSYDDYKANCRIRKPEGFNFVYDVVDALATEQPEKVALYWTNDIGEKKLITFKELSDSSKQAAVYWQKLGIKKGDRVMFILKRHWQFWVNIMALCRLGAIVIPATHLLTSHDVSYRVGEASIKCVFSLNEVDLVKAVDGSELQPSLKVVLNGRTNSKAVEKLGDDWLVFDYESCNVADFVKPEGEDFAGDYDDMLAYFTSGTTGYPKLVIHDNTYPLGHINTAVYWHDLKSDDLHFTLSDSGWGKCSWGKLYGQWIAEATVFVYDFEKFTPSDILVMIERHKITSFCAPPTVFRFLLLEDFSKYDLSSLKKVRSAGEALNPEIFNKFVELLGLEIKEGFGQTETTVILACFPWDAPRVGAMGRAAAGWNVQVIDEEGIMCEAGESGELVVRLEGEPRPVGLFQQYNSVEYNERAIKNGLYHTGDEAYCDEDGYFWFVGRNDDVIKSSGYRIGPFEVESALMEHEAVVECAVTGVPDEIRGQAIKASIILDKKFAPTDELKRDIQNFVKSITAPYKYPRVIEFVDDLPKTISGKIKRKDIRSSDSSS